MVVLTSGASLILFIVTSSQIVTSDQWVCGGDALCKCKHKSHYTRVNCTHRNLLAAPLHLPQNTKWLDISYNRLQKISTNTFSAYPSLAEIMLDYNQIREIEEGAFALNHLQKLSLNHNEISEIREGVFPSNCSITSIQLSYNRLQRIPNEAISHCTSLSSLYLRNNTISEIEGGIFQFNPNIRYLSLQSNNLRSLPRFMYRLIPKTNVVYLSTNMITEVFSSTFRDLKTVQCFALNGNQIERLPEDLFRDLLLTDTLDLSANRIEDIPQNLFIKNGTFHKMTKLFLHKNKLRFLRQNVFEGLYGLKYVFLNSNQLQSIDTGAFVGSSLQLIYLFGNNFTSIVNNSFENDNITEVHLYKNPITNFSTKALDGLQNNASLYVSCESLSVLPRYNHDVKIKCVRSEYVPTIIADTSFKMTLIRDGFNCTRYRPGKKASYKCKPCRPGTFGDCQSGCLPCPPGGFYQDEIGQTAKEPGGMACKRCNNGTFVKSGHGDSISKCQVCPEGTNQSILAGYRACVCKDNYTRTDRFGACLYCLQEGLNCSLDYKFLLPGYYWNWSFQSASINEYKNFVSNLRNNTRFFNISTTTYEKSLPRVHRCPRTESCVNNDGYKPSKLEGSCDRGYTGWLCSKCQSNYYSILNNCEPCPNKLWLCLEIGVVISLGLALCFYVRWQNKQDDDLNGNRRTLIDKASSRLKILLGFYQVVGELFESLHGLNWTYPFKVLAEITSYIKLNVIRLFFRPHCFNEKLRIDTVLLFKIRLSLPLCFVLLCFSSYQIRKVYVSYRYKGDENVKTTILKRFKATLSSWTLLFLFIIYPPTCEAIFSLYPRACQTFYFDNDNNYSVRLLRSDLDTNCDNLSQYHIIAFVATALYVAAFPCVLLFLLWKYHKKSNIRTAESINHPTVEDESQNLLSTEDVENSPVPVWLRFLCENYKRQFWYWEIIELVRKVAQTTMVTLLGWEDDLTIMLTIGAAVLFLSLHARYLPMKNAFEQRLQLFSLTAIFINVVATAIPTRHETIVQYSVVLLNITIGLIVLVEAVVGLFSYIRRRRMYVKIINRADHVTRHVTNMQANINHE